jgi:excisionase family DNA binding protein
MKTVHPRYGNCVVVTHGAKPLVTNVNGACAILHKSRDRVYRLIKSGEIASYLDGDSRRITIESLERYVEKKVAESKEYKAAAYPRRAS